MNEEDTVEPQEQVIDTVLQEAVESHETQVEQISEPEKTQVPLSALQKERKKRQELELELEWERRERARQQAPQVPQEEDNSRYESATREDLTRAQNESIRIIEERLWMKQNPEKYEKVNEYLPQFLKQRPNLASAINDASNRYEEAYELMEALSPKQQQQLKVASLPKKQAPNSPGSVPKAAAMNQALDVMSMSDSEFSAWRESKRTRR